LLSHNRAPGKGRQPQRQAKFFDCGVCGAYHRHDFYGDCRDDTERLSPGNLDEIYGPDRWEEVPNPLSAKTRTWPKVRYQGSECETKKTPQQARRHIPRLGKIIKIEGVRFISRRSSACRGYPTPLTTNHEAVRIHGENGYVRLSGVCWSYPGNGPHALVQVLEICGLPRADAEKIAFKSNRNDKPMVDWEYNCADGLWTTYDEMGGKITEPLAQINS
jgi:hypothetical protein